jgi:hypothetical protein
MSQTFDGLTPEQILKEADEAVRTANRQRKELRKQLGRKYDYHDHIRHTAQKSREASMATRGIPMPGQPKDPERRESCRFDLARFCKTYNPDAFKLPWASIHLDCIKRIEEAVIHGALYGFAMPRGSGKTSICRMAMLWGVSYSHSRYGFLVGATSGRAIESLNAVKTFIRFLPTYAEDFPEIHEPVDALQGIAHRCGGQHIGGRATMIKWGQDKIVLPTVQGSEASGNVIAVSGLTGEGIRGSLFTTSTGEQIRPDFVLLDDPQTDESARSPSQNNTRIRIISSTILGMAGPDRQLSAVMPCTIISDGDMASQVLDRNQHPLWRGTVTRMMPEMPKNMDAWEDYFEVYRRAMLAEPPDFETPNRHYLENKESLDAGASVSWPERFNSNEVSAIQSAMNLYCRDQSAFYSEYQNSPPSDLDGESVSITQAGLTKKVDKGLSRYVVPDGSDFLTAFIDISGKVLWYAVMAHKRDFSSHVVDYGVFPRPRLSYVTLDSIRYTLAHRVKKGTSFEGQLMSGLEALCDDILGKEYRTESNDIVKMRLCLIDSAWGASTETVYTFCRRSSFANILYPSRGVGITASRNPLVDPSMKKKGRDSVLGQWRLGSQEKGVPIIQYDTNHWKTFMANRIGVELHSGGSMSIFNGTDQDHRMFYEQVSAEYAVRTAGRGRELDEWSNRPGRDNHFLDCVCGCGVGASVLGARLSETRIPKKKRRDHGQEKAARPKVSYM